MRSRQLVARAISPGGVAYFSTRFDEPFRLAYVDVLDQDKLEQLLVRSLVTDDREHVIGAAVPMIWLARDSGMPPIAAGPASRVTLAVENACSRTLRVSPRLTAHPDPERNAP